MIYFEEPKPIAGTELQRSGGKPGRLHSEAILRNTVRSYSYGTGDYALILAGRGYRFIHADDEHEDDFYSKTYSSQLKALIAIRFHSLERSGGDLTESWLSKLNLDIAALRPLTDGSIHGKAKAHFAKRLVAFYGDAELGYLIGRTRLGRYRFIYYSDGGNEVSPSSRTELEALEAALLDCSTRDKRHWGMPWAEELSFRIDELLEELALSQDQEEQEEEFDSADCCDGWLEEEPRSSSWSRSPEIKILEEDEEEGFAGYDYLLDENEIYLTALEDGRW